MLFVKDKSARESKVRALMGLSNKAAIQTSNDTFRSLAKLHIRNTNGINNSLEKKAVFSAETITDFHAP